MWHAVAPALAGRFTVICPDFRGYGGSLKPPADTVHRWNTTQAQAARRLGITQTRLNDLLHGKINKFSLDTLLTLATRAGLKVKLEVRSAA